MYTEQSSSIQPLSCSVHHQYSLQHRNLVGGGELEGGEEEVEESIEVEEEEKKEERGGVVVVVVIVVVVVVVVESPAMGVMTLVVDSAVIRDSHNHLLHPQENPFTL